MRKNSIRKFIHGILDLLPLFIIPIFALNIIHKEVEPISVTTSGYEYQPLYQTNEVNTADDLVEGHLYHFSINNENLDNYLYLPTANETLIFDFVNITSYDLSYYYDFSSLDDFIPVSNVVSNGRLSFVLYLFVDLSNSIEIYINHSSGNDYFCYFAGNSFMDSGSFSLEGDFIYSSLGNPIFKDISFISASEYNLYQSVYNEGIVYNDTDVGSQFIYTLYNATDKYFNMNNLFNMGSIYDWIQLNMFGGTAPLPIYIVWNIIVYEFFMDLIFLLYAVFMFIIDFSSNMIDGFLRRSKRGE